MATNKVKKCLKCGTYLPATERNFYPLSGVEFGFDEECKQCRTKEGYVYIDKNNELTKICTECSREFPATNKYFHKKQLGKYGLSNVCKECRNIKRRNFYKNNHK